MNSKNKNNLLTEQNDGLLIQSPFKKKIITLIVLIILFVTIIPSSKIFGQEYTTQNVNIHMAVLQDNIDAIKQYIKAGLDLNVKDAYGSTPLIIAVIFNKTEAAKLLIEAGADMEITDNYGSTPLHLSALLCRTQIVKALLENSANKYARNNNGATAYDIVASPFEYDKATYDQLGRMLGPMGVKFDYEVIKETRPEIAEMLKPQVRELKEIKYEPIKRNDWQVSAPGKEELNPALVSELYFDAGKLETLYSLLVIKDGTLIAEGYFNKGSIEQLSKRASVTKSYVSAMVGIAINNGCISSVDQKMIDFFPEAANKIKDQRKKQITIRQMLQMRDGYPWEETDTVYWNELWSGRYIHDIVDFPLTMEPGTGFQYSNLTSNWLGMIVTRACKKDLKSFGQKYLFSPLNVKIGDWLQDLDGYYIGSGDIQFTARDMAKFGLLYLKNGNYEGQQIVPAEWVKESFQKYSEDINTTGIKAGRLGRYFYNVGYGYQWWSAKAGEHQFNFAWGHGGQLIILLHDLDMIIVTTADPFWGKKEHFQSWKYEQSIINVVGKFIKSLPYKE